jgi:thiol:disulfide interchange protein
MAKAKKAAATKKVTLASKSKPVVSSKKSKKAAHIAPVASHKFASAKSSSNLVVKCLTLSTYALGIAAFIITACGLILPSNDDFSANGSLGFYKLVNATEPGESSTNTLNLIGILAIVFVALAFVSYITTLVLNLKAKGKFQLYSTIFIALVAVLFVLLISATIITSIPSVNVKFINFS